jgi:hypothetical protein
MPKGFQESLRPRQRLSEFINPLINPREFLYANQT